MSSRMRCGLALSQPVCALAQRLPAIAFLQRLRGAPGQRICTDKDARHRRFQSRLGEVTETPGAGIARRERVFQDVRSGNQQKSQQMMVPQCGVTPEVIAKLKAMKWSGNTVGVASWGQALTAERQVAAVCNLPAAAQSQANAMQTAARRAEEAQPISAALTRADVQLRELETDPAGQAELARLTALRQGAEALQRSDARAAALMALYDDATRYCRPFSVHQGVILESLRTAVVARKGEHEELDHIEAEIQRLPFGVELAPEQLVLPAPTTVRDRAQRLAGAHHCTLHGARPDFASHCTRH